MMTERLREWLGDIHPSVRVHSTRYVTLKEFKDDIRNVLAENERLRAALEQYGEGLIDCGDLALEALGKVEARNDPTPTNPS